MKRPQVISLGETLWDLFPDGERFGGAPANFACHAAILGADVSMISAVGDDRRGQEAVAILRGYGIDVSLLQVILGALTGTVGVAIDGAGKPTFTIHEDSAWDRIAWSKELESRITDADVAKESSELASANMLQMAAISVLSQANQQPMVAMKLIG